MKITRRQLRQMILEQMDVTVGEGPAPLRLNDPRRVLGHLYVTSLELRKKAMELKRTTKASGNSEVAQFLKQLGEWLGVIETQGYEYRQYAGDTQWTWDWDTKK